jgi:hypothetical protein
VAEGVDGFVVGSSSLIFHICLSVLPRLAGLLFLRLRTLRNNDPAEWQA